MESSLGQVETYTKEITKTIQETVTDKCIGLMVVSIRENGGMVSNTDEVTYVVI